MKSMNKTRLFLLLTFGISFSLAGIFKLLAGDTQAGKTMFMLLGIVYMFVPTIAVLIIKKVICKEELKRDLFISFKFNRWFLVAWFITPLLAFCTIPVSVWLFSDVSYSSVMRGVLSRYQEIMTPQQLGEIQKALESLPFSPVWLMLLQALIAGVTVNAIAGFGEELGWRGFLLREFSDMHFLRASVLIGFIWGIWHTPLILMGHNYPQHPEIGVLMMTVWCILLSILFTYITIKSGSVIAASVMHGTLNAIAGIAIVLIEGGNDLQVGVTGFAGFLTLAFFLMLIFLYDRFISREGILTSKISRYIYPVS